MYRALAKAAKNSADKQTFLRLAGEEGRHAAVFFKLTDTKLQPKATQAKALVLLYKVLGRKLLYPMIALGEEAAVKKYASFVTVFSDVKEIKADEKRHAREVRALLK